MVRDDTYFAPWARFNLTVWLDTSETFRRLQPDDRRLAGALFLWNSARGPIPDIPLSLARAAWEDDTSRVPEIRSKMASFGFELEDGKWSNANAMKAWRSARGISEKRAVAGAAGGAATRAARVAEGVAEQLPEQLLQQTPLTLISPSPSSSPSVVVVEEQGSLFEPILPPSREAKRREIVETFLIARHMRLHGTTGNRRAPSAGMVEEGVAKLKPLLDKGFERDLIVSLPALVEDRNLPDGTPLVDAMLKRDPFVLLRVDNAQGGKCHALRYEAALNGMFLNDRQAAILRNLGTLDYVKGKGAKTRDA